MSTSNVIPFRPTPPEFVLSEWRPTGIGFVRDSKDHEAVVSVFLSEDPYVPTTPWCYVVHHPEKPGFTCQFGWAKTEELAKKVAMVAAAAVGWEHNQNDHANHPHPSKTVVPAALETT